MTETYTFEDALQEIGKEEFDKKYHKVFGKPILDYVDTIVINLPEPCYANCPYCMDKAIRNQTITNKTFLKTVDEITQNFSKSTRVCLTGGTMNPTDFDKMLTLIENNLTTSNPFITWNTNGIGFYEEWNKWQEVLSKHYIAKINLHRNSAEDTENAKCFCTNKKVLTLSDAKTLFKDTLTLRITITEDFKLEPYADLNIPLYLNPMVPFTPKTARVFLEVKKELSIVDKQITRRNAWLNTTYKNIPIRVCMGDRSAKRHPNREPVFMNVVIIHRNGVAGGTWYDDDKVIYRPREEK